MSFADQVQAATISKSSNVGHVVRALNVLPKKLRNEVVAFIENPPAGTQKIAMARALSKVAAEHGYECKLTAQHMSTFLAGERYGLEA